MVKRNLVRSIVIDSQEIVHGHAWKFPGYRTSVRSLLRYGVDYQPYGYAGKVGVERKALADYAACLGKRWKHFRKNQIAKLQRLRYGIIIVEGLPTQDSSYSRLPASAMISRSMLVMALDVPVFYAGNVALAQHACLQFFYWAARQIQHESDSGPGTGRAILAH